MTIDIKVFQIDDWAYIAAASKEEAEAHAAVEYERPEDQDDWECRECTLTPDLIELLKAHTAEGSKFPALIGIDAHYA